MANLVESEGGTDASLNPWVGVVIGIAVATGAAFLFGLISSRSEGIYFLMITLAFGILTFNFFVQVTELSGFGGLNQIALPGYLGNPRLNPNPLYYTTFVVAVVVYLLLRYVVRTPFGLTLQGIRDDPTRMRALGYNVPFHRALAFTFAGFIAAVAASSSSGGTEDLARLDGARGGDQHPHHRDHRGHLPSRGGVGRRVRLRADRQLLALRQRHLRLPPRGSRPVQHRHRGLFFLIVLLSPGGIIGIGTSLCRGHAGSALGARRRRATRRANQLIGGLG